MNRKSQWINIYECAILIWGMMYFIIYVISLAIKDIVKFICWWTIVPVVCIVLLVVDKIKRWRIKIYG